MGGKAGELVAKAKDLAGLILDASELVKENPKYERWVEDFNRAFPASGATPEQLRIQKISSLSDILYSPSTPDQDGKVGDKTFSDWIEPPLSPKIVYFDVCDTVKTNYVEIYGVAQFADFVILKQDDQNRKEVEKRISLATDGLYFVADSYQRIRPAIEEDPEQARDAKDRKAIALNSFATRPAAQDLRETVRLTILGNDETTQEVLNAAAELHRVFHSGIKLEIFWEPGAASDQHWGCLSIAESAQSPKWLNEDRFNRSTVDERPHQSLKTARQLQELLRIAIEEFTPRFVLVERKAKLPEVRLPIPVVLLEQNSSASACNEPEWVSRAKREGKRIEGLTGALPPPQEPLAEWPPALLLEMAWLRRLEIAATEIAERVLLDHVEHAKWEHGLFEKQHDRSDESDQAYVNRAKECILIERSRLPDIAYERFDLRLTELGINIQKEIGSKNGGTGLALRNQAELIDDIKKRIPDIFAPPSQKTAALSAAEIPETVPVGDDADQRKTPWARLHEHMVLFRQQPLALGSAVPKAVGAALQAPMRYVLPFAFILAPIIAVLSGGSSDTTKQPGQQLQQFLRTYGIALIPLFLFVTARAKEVALAQRKKTEAYARARSREIEDNEINAFRNAQARKYFPYICDEMIKENEQTLAGALALRKKRREEWGKRAAGRLSRLETLQKKLVGAVADEKDGSHALYAQAFHSLTALSIPRLALPAPGASALGHEETRS